LRKLASNTPQQLGVERGLEGTGAFRKLRDSSLEQITSCMAGVAGCPGCRRVGIVMASNQPNDESGENLLEVNDPKLVFASATRWCIAEEIDEPAHRL
jgi:hypothetical protein